MQERTPWVCCASLRLSRRVSGWLMTKVKRYDRRNTPWSFRSAKRALSYCSPPAPRPRTNSPYPLSHWLGSLPHHDGGTFHASHTHVVDSLPHSDHLFELICYPPFYALFVFVAIVQLDDKTAPTYKGSSRSVYLTSRLRVTPKTGVGCPVTRWQCSYAVPSQ